MPMSWVKTPSGTSRRMRECMGEDWSKQNFEACVGTLVDSSGGRVLGVWFEQNAKYAHVHFYWDTLEQKAAILYDLQGEDVVDLITAPEADELVAEREAC
ncbi:MAG: hypothetical protein ACXVRJ_11865 [Gaiellaceae bacterium]